MSASTIKFIQIFVEHVAHGLRPSGEPKKIPEIDCSYSQICNSNLPALKETILMNSSIDVFQKEYCIPSTEKI